MKIRVFVVLVLILLCILGGSEDFEVWAAKWEYVKDS